MKRKPTFTPPEKAAIRRIVDSRLGKLLKELSEERAPAIGFIQPPFPDEDDEE